MPLDYEEVINIRERRAKGEALKVLAADYDRSLFTIHEIVTGDRYPKYGGPIVQAIPRVYLDSISKARVRRLYKEGWKQKDIASEFQVSITQIRNTILDLIPFKREDRKNGPRKEKENKVRYAGAKGY